METKCERQLTALESTFRVACLSQGDAKKDTPGSVPSCIGKNLCTF